MLPDGRGQAIVVVGVLEGSDADKVGRAGMHVHTHTHTHTHMHVCSFSHITG
jgi:hypothetical protein